MNYNRWMQKCYKMKRYVGWLWWCHTVDYNRNSKNYW